METLYAAIFSIHLTLSDDIFQALEPPLHPDFRRLRHYAARVKQIAYRQNIQIHPTLLSMLLADSEVALIFRKLTDVQLSLMNCYSICPVISLTTGLKKVDLDLGFTTSAFKAVNEAAFDFISTVNRVASPSFTSLSLRGAASQNVMYSVNSLLRLDFLSIRVGGTLPAETVAAIATFPSLRTLEIHTSHLSPEDLCFATSPCFPSLEVLDIRGRTGFIEKLLQNMQSDRLSVLRLDVERLALSDDSWVDLFAVIKSKTHASLIELAVEHHMDTEDLPLDDDSNSNTAYTDNIFFRTNPNALLKFELLHSLSSHHFLRRVTFETTPPIVVRDQDLEQMAKWWPNLNHLDLGSLPTFDPRWSTKATPAGLSLLSRGFPVLETLVIPVDICGLTAEAATKISQNSKSSLKNITLTSLTPPDQSMAQLLHRLFPLLIEIHGTYGHEDQWSCVQSGFQLLQTSC